MQFRKIHAYNWNKLFFWGRVQSVLRRKDVIKLKRDESRILKKTIKPFDKIKFPF
jgi:hypothetical protein